MDPNSNILDVGCGNNSSFVVKNILPSSTYTGVDISDYNQTKPNLADYYLLTKPEEFASSISYFIAEFDAVISNHNLEHCYNCDQTLFAMMNSLKPGGNIFLSFPSMETLRFPSRKGTLNYYDDKTHASNPPDFDKIIKTLKANGFNIIFKAKNYSPFLLYLLGFILEPISSIRKKIMLGTWEYYGFESIIIAKKQ